MPGGLFSGPSAPPAPPPAPRMPTPDGAAILKAKQSAMQDQVAASGRNSTILTAPGTTTDKLGG